MYCYPNKVTSLAQKVNKPVGFHGFLTSQTLTLAF